MSEDTAERTDPALWEAVKADMTAGAKGGKKGQWSARKAQLAVAEYKRRGGGYVGERDAGNSLHQWTEEEWGTKSGKPSGKTDERYLPKKAREALSDEDYRRTTAAKRADSRRGRQYSSQPDDIAARTARYRDGGEPTKSDLYTEAKRRGIAGRSTMNKAELVEALGR